MTPEDPTLIVRASELRKLLRSLLQPLVAEAFFRAESRVADLGGIRWISNRHAQERLQISRATLARYRAKGLLPFSKVGSSVFYKIDDINRLLEEHRVNARAVDTEGSSDNHNKADNLSKS